MMRRTVATSVVVQSCGLHVRPVSYTSSRVLLAACHTPTTFRKLYSYESCCRKLWIKLSYPGNTSFVACASVRAHVFCRRPYRVLSFAVGRRYHRRVAGGHGRPRNLRRESRKHQHVPINFVLDSCRCRLQAWRHHIPIRQHVVCGI